MAGRVPPSRGVAPHVGVALLLLLAVGSASSRRPEPYYGRLIGRLNQYAHGIKGTVYAVDESTVFIRGFAYDGTGPDAYFWVGDTPQPTPEGILVPYPEDYDTSKDPPILLAHSNSDILLRLPAGKRLRDIKWLSVWCRRFTVNFGDVFIPAGLDPPRPRVLPEFKRLAHGLRSGNISVLDAKTFYIPNLHYDGAGPDAYFWVGNGSEPNPFGTKVPNEVGSLNPLRGYQGEDIEIQLPGKLTAYDIDWLAVWCVEYRHNFGHVYIPKDLDVPPALGQTKITTSSTTSQTPYTTTNNCKEILDKRLQVRWEVQGDQVQITLSARLRKDQYMSFGISGAEGRPAMLGADVVVAYWDSKGNQPKASDYTITHLAQCDGERGVCPDHKLGGSNDVVVVSGSQKNGITTITYRRPLAAKESSKDKEILTSRSQSVIAAFGPLNSKLEANAHSFMDTTRHDVQLDFGATNDNTCIGLAELDERGPQPWAPRVLSGLTNFTARIGPAGGKRGYTPVTDHDIIDGFLPFGHPSWGIAWYINDQLIPEIYVERGKTYTFFVEGGDDRTNPAKYHPFYISDSSEGGFGQKKEEDQRKQRVFAGVAYDNEGYPYPTAVGRYCEWTHKTVDQWAKAETFEEYMQTLQLECNNGEPAALNWTVAHETPDLVYYQCYTHNNLGWKIHVVDPGTAVPMPGDQKARMNTATTFPPLSALSPLVIMTALRNMAAR
ncbi:protein Skeletor, isoforms B/C isoform X1 [Manduca sexta]|uniref:protein Skeletor, isoforms B/C isoform X1 n=1 Tax=Manduca sexta TaxID=7130 RepID=UPI001182FC6F|nr:protein Skeletor, isoforms B/C isoform X1 [Manduca sexta]XP_037295977.1 protein Skeletor, isoforms B/C isoform X1 [Manduca sexta]